MRATGRSMRQVYAELDVLNAITGTPPPPERIDRRDRLLVLRFDGVPFADLPEELRSANSDEIVYAKHLGEMKALGQVLVGCNVDADVADIFSLESPRPDFQLALRSGARPYVELARVADDGTHSIEGAMTTIRKGLFAALDDDVDLRDRLGSNSLEVELRAGAPARPVDQERTVVEIVELAKQLDFANEPRLCWSPVTAELAILHRLGGHFIIARRPVTHLGVPTAGNALPSGVQRHDRRRHRRHDRREARKDRDVRCGRSAALAGALPERDDRFGELVSPADSAASRPYPNRSV
jgi:hypothetical protein